MVKNRKKVIIVGGGTAGLVISKSIQEYCDVTIIEKSKYRKYPLWFKIPLLIGILLRRKDNKYISRLNLLSQEGRNIPFFESNILGGASVINGCVHMLGSKLYWKEILNKFDSNYNELLKSYDDLYTFDKKNKNKIYLDTAYQNSIDRSFFSALEKEDIPIGNMDYSNIQACGPIINTVSKYFRTSVLTFINKHSSAEYYLNECVEELLFNNSKKVVGVKTNKQIIEADYVILSGGVIGTSSLLMKNNSNETSPLDNLISGSNIQDHTNLRINVLTKRGINSLNEISYSFFKKLLLVLKHFSGKNTLMRGTGATSAAHLDLNGDGEIDTRIQIVQFRETGRHEGDTKLFSSREPGFSISITAIRPKSKGKVEIIDSDKIVNPMYLSSQDDIELLKLALRFCLKLLRSEHMSENVLKIEKETEIVNNPEKYILNNYFSGYHLIGGSNEAINSNFEVYNTKGLYVCDASIFSSYAASNIHSSVVLIADIFSKKFIRNNFNYVKK
jgi:hypothetical protein